MAMNENIESISPHIIPLLVRTYQDVNAPAKSRGAAALGLIKTDRNRAESLFINFLDNQDAEIVSTAIVDLGIARSDKSFTKIISFVHNPNKKIRWAVVDYLGKFNNPESITLLKQMMRNDSDESVRGWATYQLQQLGVLPIERG
jgi:HEAT repeat protein